MAFVASRNDVGFFGFISNSNLILLPAPFAECCHKGIDKVTYLKHPSVDSDVIDSNTELDEVQRKKDDIHNLTCAAISNCGDYIVTSDCNKLLYTWRKCEDRYILLSSRTLYRKCFKVIFSNSGSDILASDRAGDVYTFSVANPKNPETLLLGHVCIILDMELSNDDKFIITCDRDNKIRVSHYPNAYNIEIYCFGHEEFVSALQVILTKDRLLLSGSGDGTLRLWKYCEGKEEYCHNLVKDGILSINDSTVSIIPEVENSDSEISGVTQIIRDKAVNSDVLNISNNSHSSSVNTNSASFTSSVLNKNKNNFLVTAKANETKYQIGVKLMRYCHTHQLLGVLFFTHPQIAIYDVNISHNGKKINLIQILTHQSTPCDLYFDFSGYLWVLLPQKEECVVIYVAEKMKGQVRFKILEVITEVKIGTIISEVNNKRHVFQDSIQVESLYKKSFSNGDGSYEQSKREKQMPLKKRNKII